MGRPSPTKVDPTVISPMPSRTTSSTTPPTPRCLPAVGVAPTCGRASSQTIRLNGQNRKATSTATMKPGWPRRSASRQTQAMLAMKAASSRTAAAIMSNSIIPIPISPRVMFRFLSCEWLFACRQACRLRCPFTMLRRETGGRLQGIWKNFSQAVVCWCRPSVYSAKAAMSACSSSAT